MSQRSGSGGSGAVTAVIVSHNGEPWIPRLLSALEACSVRPDSVVCVDTASTDASVDLLSEAFGTGALVRAPASCGFGSAVALGLAEHDARTETAPDASPDDGWIWLLHDDCAPAADALQRVLETAATDPAIAVVGCRLRSWPRGRRLLEVGVTITGTGRRYTGLEPGEYDQGQHHEARTVLAVSSAGMLVRRSVWDRLGGFEPALPLFRDDVDFGWRVAKAGWRVVVTPEAVVFHSEAATRGARSVASTSPNPHRADRRAALFTLLANTSAWSLPWQAIRLIGGSLLRAFGYLVGKLPAAAADEMAALAWTASRPGAITAARSARKSTTTVKSRRLRSLFPGWPAPYLDGLDALLSRFGAPRGTGDPVAASAGRRLPALLLLTCVLAVTALVAARGLLVGGRLLHGGSLLPAPGGAADWWHLYGQTRHSAGFGSELVTAPYVVALGLFAGLLLGKAWLAIDVIMLLAVPLAAAGAYVAAGRLVSSLPVRLWMSGTYGLIPVLTGSVTTGHLGTVVGLIALPWLVPVAVRLFDSERGPTWQSACSCGIVLAVVVAFAPLAAPMAVALLVVGAPLLVARGQPRAIGYAAVAVLAPVVLLAPWSLRVAAQPSLLLTEPGLLDTATRSAGSVAWQLPFGRLAAEGSAPWWLTAGVLIAAVCAALRRDHRSVVAAAWLVLAVALATVAVLSTSIVRQPLTGQFAFGWLGFPVGLAQGAALVAAGIWLEGLAGMRTGSVTIAKLIAVPVGLVALAAPVAGAIWWLAVAPEGQLTRHLVDPLPVYMSDALVADPGRRALVISGSNSHVTYQILVGDGLRLGDDSVLPQTPWRGLTTLVSDLLSEPRPRAARWLAALDIRYVVLPSPADPRYVATLDGLAGLTRASTDIDQAVGWQVGHRVARSQAGRSAESWALAATADEQPALLSRHRPQWLAAEAAVWLVALVLATPSFIRRDLVDEDER
jgi:GT2 family glycosyltransferase